MCCSNRVARDFMKNFEKSNAEDVTKGSQSSSSSESHHAHNQDNMRSLDLFRERHLLKVQHLIQKSTKGDARKTRTTSSCRRRVPFHAGARPPTFLERQLLPTLKTDDADPLLVGEKSEGAAQLTIFYKGAVNVYDNVSVDTAKAIMLLAGESSLVAPPATKDKAEKDASKPIRETNPTSVCKLQTNLPIASRRSLMTFFDKRRDRIMNNSTFATQKHIKQEYI